MKQLTPSEVRLGNLTTHGVVISVDRQKFITIDSEGRQWNSFHTPDIEPLPLTNDVLKSFGFSVKKFNDYMSEDRGERRWLILHDYDFGFEICEHPSISFYKHSESDFLSGDVRIPLGSIFGFKILFAHELQNFVKDILKEELTYQPIIEQHETN